MSQAGQSSRTITLEEALEQLSLLESQLNQLQATIREIEVRIAQLTAVEDALASLAEGAEDALIPLDGRGTVLVPASIKKLERILVHAGLNVFVEVDREKALEYLRDEKAALSKLLDAYSREYARLAQYYSALRSAIESALQAAPPQAKSQQSQQ
ncbi:prefoldin subunit alpha [Hyperthermus butylicus]|uniref:Prefoldin subunit alpha n=1 Tax=Hyperthermus butylicus (strain DSM 5456 / JCM 9403 / PLM1-5) TaxID=415426 RepID=PFDA_HYPBU|nr:prefoldin subunit alpha [Hyperthermus butylicus]A2BN59.1 RecName: Full=Prefoldin subunit alpha; AltName: Full=GimC subunit alpha [Hyperthermus butylicus DSM 5456]ABM81420.1 hypothetical protein Hbut_1601 [Hyperthermus butylicus DSM 5456]